MKRVFLTGGSRGLGAACVKAFGQKGWQVCFTYRSGKEEARALCESVPNASCLFCDLSDPEEVYALASRLGTFDAVVNNAGEALFGLLQDADFETVRRFFNVDLFSPLQLLRALCPKMLGRGGAAVNVASIWGQCGASCEALYSAAKGGLISLTKALAWELAPSGIRVNAVSPGIIETAMNARFTEEEKRALRASVPLGRFATPEEIAALVVFLCEEDSSYMTGQVLSPNGGQYMEL